MRNSTVPPDDPIKSAEDDAVHSEPVDSFWHEPLPEWLQAPQA